MKLCKKCGKPIPEDSYEGRLRCDYHCADHIEVRVFGYDLKGADFCKPECFEEYYSEKRYVLD